MFDHVRKVLSFFRNCSLSRVCSHNDSQLTRSQLTSPLVFGPTPSTSAHHIQQQLKATTLISYDRPSINIPSPASTSSKSHHSTMKSTILAVSLLSAATSTVLAQSGADSSREFGSERAGPKRERARKGLVLIHCIHHSIHPRLWHQRQLPQVSRRSRQQRPASHVQ